MLKGNKGEWSELYTFTYLLSSGVLYAADEELDKLENFFYPIVGIIREEHEGEVFHYDTGEKIKIFRNNVLVDELDQEDFKVITRKLLEEINLGTGAFEIPSIDAFFKKIHCSRVTLSSRNKEDILLKLHDVNTGIKTKASFSVKSFLGSNPTLINAGTNTNFTYELLNCTKQIAETVNGIVSGKKIIERINFLINSGVEFQIQPERIKDNFLENLRFIDSLMPEILSYIVLYSYIFNMKECNRILDKVKERNPLKFSNTYLYEYKFKKLLSAFALGLTPTANWEGKESANGGYIVVKKDGSIVCYHIYNREQFEEYLFAYTVFDRPSIERHRYMSVFEKDGRFFIDMNLQVRFRK